MALCIDQWMSQGMPQALAKELRLNFGGTLYVNLSLAGSNYNVTVPDDVQNVRHVLLGALTQDVTYTFPLVSGFFFVNNQTTGPHAVTLVVRDGDSLVINSGEKFLIFVDAMLGTIDTEATTGTQVNTLVNITHADSTYTVPNGVNRVTADSTAGDIAIVLPSAASSGLEIGVARTVNANGVSISALGGTLINGLSSYPLNGAGDSLLLNSNGIGWWSF